jgi:hypothetical protein
MAYQWVGATVEHAGSQLHLEHNTVNLCDLARASHRSFKNKLRDAGAVALAKALETNSSVTKIEYVVCGVRLLYRAV